MPTTSTQTTKDKATQCPAKRPPAGVKSEKAKPNTSHSDWSTSLQKALLLLHKKVVVDRVAYENAHDERWEKELELLRANHKKPFESVWEKDRDSPKGNDEHRLRGRHARLLFVLQLVAVPALIGLVCVRVHRFQCDKKHD